METTKKIGGTPLRLLFNRHEQIVLLTMCNLLSKDLFASLNFWVTIKKKGRRLK